MPGKRIYVLIDRNIYIIIRVWTFGMNYPQLYCTSESPTYLFQLVTSNPRFALYERL